MGEGTEARVGLGVGEGMYVRVTTCAEGVLCLCGRGCVCVPVCVSFFLKSDLLEFIFI